MRGGKKSLFRAARSVPASHGPLQVAIFCSYELMIRFGQDFTRWPFARLHGGLVRASPLLTPLPARAGLQNLSAGRIHTRLARVARAVLPSSGISLLGTVRWLHATCRACECRQPRVVSAGV